MQKSPCVFIVGAGPGDPGLISVRGQRQLEAADVVVYDHQVHARLLRSARHDAERIDVGPAAPRALDQEAISLLLVEKAREGKTVVRLKVGDPFVFDSGGKEALFLHEQQVPFEVVPGIPGTIGIPAYAGIPLTYPGGGDIVTLIRGNEAETEAPPKVDWALLAGLDGTLVSYAGARWQGPEDVADRRDPGFEIGRAGAANLALQRIGRFVLEEAVRRTGKVGAIGDGHAG